MSEYELDLNIVREIDLVVDTTIYKGADGTTFYPTVSSAGVISWTNDGDKENPDPVNIKGPQGDQGPAGQDGTNGATFTPTVSSAGVISWSNDKGLPNPDSVNIKGPAGQNGQNGATFTPSVSTAGIISWTNDGGLPNPESVDIKGPAGQNGQGVPSGGTTGQVLKKASATDYDTEWANESGGGAGVFLITVTNHTSSNKTYDEIKTAYDGGQTLVVFNSYDGEKEYMPLSRFYASRFYFESIYQKETTTNIHAFYSHRLIIEKTSGGTTKGTWQESVFGGIPSGGLDGYYLMKSGSTNYSVSWGSAPRGVPAPLSGGTGYVLTQTGNTTFAWQAPQGKLPAGGSNGQILTKYGSSDYNAVWDTPQNVLPTGGTAGQVLKKNSGTNYDVSWSNESGGGGGLFVATFSDSGGSVVCDKTADEVRDAADAGTPIIGYYNGVILSCDAEEFIDNWSGYFRGYQYLADGTVHSIEIYLANGCSLSTTYKPLKYWGAFYPSQNSFSLYTSANDCWELFQFFDNNRLGECIACVDIDYITREFSCAQRGNKYDEDLDEQVFFARFTCSEVVENSGVYELHVFSFDSEQYQSNPSTIVVKNYAEKKVVLSAV